MKLCDARILFVDDEPSLLEIFAEWFAGESPVQITTAADGQEALEKIESGDYDLLITDVNMPRVNGPEFMRRIAASGKTLPGIVFVSGFGNIDLRELHGLGVEAFLAKPVLRDTLLDVVGRALSERAELWLRHFDTAPRHSVSIKVLDFSDHTAGGHLALGRGGFSVCYASPVAPGKVFFDCELTGPGLRLSGEGYLRWKSKTEGLIGIEIAYLDASCRSAVIEEIDRRRPTAFIPCR